MLVLHTACQSRSFPSDVVRALDELILLTSSCQYRILLKFRVHILTKSHSVPNFSNFWITHLDLLHQISNFSNLVDFQLICQLFTVGDPRPLSVSTYFMFQFGIVRFRLRRLHNFDLLSEATAMSEPSQAYWLSWSCRSLLLHCCLSPTHRYLQSSWHSHGSHPTTLGWSLPPPTMFSS